MKAISLLLFSFAILFHQPAFSQTEEKYIDFTMSPGVILSGDIQVALNWLTPNEYRKTQASLMDIPQINELHPNNNQMIVSKIALISKKSFDELSYNKMNNALFISEMLNSVGIRTMGADFWRVTNRVKAYSIPFKVSFDFKFKEVTEGTLGTEVSKYIKNEASGLKGTGRERYLTLDMTNFSQLMYQNYSIVYMKEISPKETIIIAGLIAGFDLRSGNTYFNFPPFSTTKSTMMGNLRSQILQMARSIQK